MLKLKHLPGITSALLCLAAALYFDELWLTLSYIICLPFIVGLLAVHFDNGKIKVWNTILAPIIAVMPGANWIFALIGFCLLVFVLIQNKLDFFEQDFF